MNYKLRKINNGILNKLKSGLRIPLMFLSLRKSIRSLCIEPPLDKRTILKESGTASRDSKLILKVLKA